MRRSRTRRSEGTRSDRNVDPQEGSHPGAGDTAAAGEARGAAGAKGGDPSGPVRARHQVRCRSAPGTFPCDRRFPTISPLARDPMRTAGVRGTFVSRPERCRSGRTGLTRNQLSLPGDRGFESLPLRQKSPKTTIYEIRTTKVKSSHAAPWHSLRPSRPPKSLRALLGVRDREAPVTRMAPPLRSPDGRIAALPLGSLRIRQSGAG